MKKTGLILLLIILPIIISAQENSSWKERFFTGGNLGLQFGTETIIDVSPLIGYKITERFRAGVGIKYQYYRYKSKTFEFDTHVFGGNAFTQFYPLQNIFLHAEYEILNIENLYIPGQRVTTNSCFLGGGYNQPLGENANSAVFIMVLWDVIEDVYSPYQNPVIRAGVYVGI